MKRHLAYQHRCLAGGLGVTVRTEGGKEEKRIRESFHGA